MPCEVSIIREFDKRLLKDTTLNNGDLIVLMCTNGGHEDREYTFMISSYIPDSDNCISTTRYCSLVNLQTGGKALAERCSRNTTTERVLNHLSRHTKSYNTVLMRQYKSNECKINLVVPK